MRSSLLTRPRFGLRRCRLGPVLGAALLATAAQAADPLPALQADATRTTVAGLSSGGFMAVQYAVAHSVSVAGVGVIAGGPYNCAHVTPGGITSCLAGGVPKPDGGAAGVAPSGPMAWAAAQGFALLGQIDPVAGLARQRVYVFSGTRDAVVKPPVVAATRGFFQAAGVPDRQLSYVHTLPAGHAFLTPSFGSDCGRTEPPFMVHCRWRGQPYDQARAVLQHLHGRLKPEAAALSSTVRPFDQRPFASPGSSLDSVGFVYVPTACQADARRCAVHVLLHGCAQGAQSVGSDVYAQAGYNRWADTNRLIVLYPQVVKSDHAPTNPEGCWDWWGYSGLNFQTRSGVQVRAIHQMVARLTGG